MSRCIGLEGRLLDSTSSRALSLRIARMSPIPLVMPVVFAGVFAVAQLLGGCAHASDRSASTPPEIAARRTAEVRREKPKSTPLSAASASASQLDRWSESRTTSPPAIVDDSPLIPLERFREPLIAWLLALLVIVGYLVGRAFKRKREPGETGLDREPLNSPRRS